MAESAVTTGACGSLHAVLPLLEFLENEGLDPRAVLERAGIPRSVVAAPDTRLPQGKFEALWHAAIEATGDPAIALRVSTLVKPSTLGVIGYLASASESRRNAFELVKGLTPLLWEDFECDLESRGELAFLRCGTGARSRASRFIAEYAVGLAISMSRALGAARSGPREAWFRHPPPPYAGACERILGLPVRFDAEADGVLFPLSVLDSANPSADAALRELLERYAADQLARIVSDAPFPQRVRACVRSGLRSGELSAERVAARLALSPRTLRRRLREAGTGYQEILDDVRAELARRYLARERRGIEEVAFLLGFSDPSAFSKAFRRWTGRTPADFARAAGPPERGDPEPDRNRQAAGPQGTGPRPDAA